MPATRQATIAARLDWLSPTAKHTLTAAAGVGSRFSCDPLASPGIDRSANELINAQLIDEVRFAPQPSTPFAIR